MSPATIPKLTMVPVASILERAVHHVYDKILNGGPGRGARIDFAFLGWRIHRRANGGALSLRHVHRELHGIVPHRVGCDSSCRKGPLESKLETPDTDRFYRRLHHVLHLRARDVSQLSGWRNSHG